MDIEMAREIVRESVSQQLRIGALAAPVKGAMRPGRVQGLRARYCCRD